MKNTHITRETKPTDSTRVCTSSSLSHFNYTATSNNMKLGQSGTSVSFVRTVMFDTSTQAPHLLILGFCCYQQVYDVPFQLSSLLSLDLLTLHPCNFCFQSDCILLRPLVAFRFNLPSIISCSNDSRLSTCPNHTCLRFLNRLLGDCGHIRHGLKREGGLLCPFRGGRGSWVHV